MLEKNCFASASPTAAKLATLSRHRDTQSTSTPIWLWRVMKSGSSSFCETLLEHDNNSARSQHRIGSSSSSVYTGTCHTQIWRPLLLGSTTWESARSEGYQFVGMEAPLPNGYLTSTSRAGTKTRNSLLWRRLPWLVLLLAGADQLCSSTLSLHTHAQGSPIISHSSGATMHRLFLIRKSCIRSGRNMFYHLPRLTPRSCPRTSASHIDATCMRKR